MSHRIRIYQQGAPSVLRYEDFEPGEPGAGEVRLRQDAAGVNFVDTMFRDGTFGVQLPFAMGVEGAGIIEAIGPGVSRFKAGDRVAYWFSFGSYADKRIINADALVNLPPQVSTEEAAALLAKGLTAWALVKRVHIVKLGATVLVHAAAGGVGSLVAAWAQALGARVIATVGSPAKADAVRKRGFDPVLDANDPDLASTIKASNGGNGVDAVYELVGASTFDQSVAAIRDGGDLVHSGNASGSPIIDEAALVKRSIRYVKPSTGQVINNRKILDEASDDLFAALQEGVFGKLAIARYPLRDASQAHEDIAARRAVGSIILTT
ncbi:quinone oxidoreductase [Rhizobium sp. 18065]|uniref:quinone oxidoreductase family protein n=1 Tax=Rhizobium sp. 18065 TaxID=2681411 RepID=UPI00135AA1E5|nr:quinone oxidoreductase [Rhizobium sp. 18065]